MAVKPESAFISRVHKRLPAKLHREKMHNAYRGGTADVWYSGPMDDLWIEYKYLPTVPVRKDVSPDLSALQRLWLDGRLAEGRNVAVVIGCPRGGVVLEHGAWQTPMTPDEFVRQLKSVEDIARWITTYTSGAQG